MLDPQHPWLDRQAYPFTSRYATIGDHRLHYIDEGEGPLILFVHGTPSWSFDYRHLIQHLSGEFRCIAIDLMGFGLSDKPKNYDYSTPNHVQVVTQFIEQLKLSDLHLVLHDFGGVIGMAYAIDRPKQIKSITMFNSWLWDASHEPEFQQSAKILRSPLLPFMYLRLNFSPRFLVPKSFHDKTKLRKSTHRHYTKVFTKAAERHGPLAFARSILNDQQWFGSLWKKVHRLQDKPILFLWGMQDPFVLPKYLDKYASAFPKAQIRKLEDCGHFPQEEKKEEVKESLSSFLHQQINVAKLASNP
ncbi:MAG: alpha/beta fold hydrolase [Saprospiraceae bacterium]|nr:alpha/beta fold hydrolase [Saprospiraceae bacterium]